MARLNVSEKVAYREHVRTSRIAVSERVAYSEQIQIIKFKSPTNVTDLVAFSESIQILPQVYPPAMPIVASSPDGVIPQQGSGIYESWAQERKAPQFVHEHWDKHHSGRSRFDDTGRGWNLRIQCTKAKAVEIWDFINDHLGAGKSFYFYDLQANGFQYDATGVLEDGRYTVRLVGDSFSRRQNSNGWFSFEFAVLEVE